MKRYKYQAMVTLLPGDGTGPPAALPGTVCRMVVRARHRDTRATKMFSALVSAGGGDLPAVPDTSMTVTVIVLGDDAGDYLAPGEHFSLWRGHDLGSGVVTRRVFV